MLNKNSDRQEVIEAHVNVSAVSVAGETGNIIAQVDLPANARVIGGEIVVLTAFDSTTNVVDIGDGVDPDRYGAAVDLKTPGRTALVLTGNAYSAADSIDLTYTETGTAPTAGEARISVQYVVDGRAAFSQGLSSGEGYAREA